MPTLFSKPHFTVPEMIVKLKSKGIDVDNSHAKELLEFKNYYRFIPYVKLQTLSAEVPSCIDFKYIERRYKFDKKLRILMFEATESIENFVRNDITEYFRVSGQNFYSDFLNPSSQPIESFNSNGIVAKLNKSFVSSDFDGLVFHKRSHGCTLENIPVWVLVEALEFGTTIWLVDEIKKFDDLKKTRYLLNITSNKYDITVNEYITCLKSCKALRNMCAHGNRLYKHKLNRHKPKYPSRWPFVDLSNNNITPDNTDGLYRKLVGFKAFYKNKQEYWFDFLILIQDHFEANKDLVSYADYHFPPDWERVLLDIW